MMEKLIANPWLIAGPVLLACFGAHLVYRNNQKNRFAVAALRFRATFLEAFAGLYPIPTNWPSNIDAQLRQIFPQLQRAVMEFRAYVPWHTRCSFDGAWFVYRLGADGREIDKQLYHQYMGFRSPGEPVIDPKETFRTNVAKLLSFANET